MNFIDSFNNIFSVMPFLAWLGIIYLVVSYFFWREARILNKDRNSIFDLWFVSFFGMAIWGRMSFVGANWSALYEGLPWSLLPYERYANNIYLFRLLPWKFITVWDGGFLFSGVAVAFIVISFAYIVLVKKWSWKQMMMPIITFSQYLLSLTLVVYGSLMRYENAVILGLFLLLAVIIITIVRSLFSDKYFVVKYVFPIYTLLSELFIGYIFYSAQVALIDKINVGLLILVTIIMVIKYLTELLRPKTTIESISAVKPISPIVLNKPVKIS
ncbi:MAG TPA: hypothetical protein PLX79_00485 [Candidatus Dojkabacteria bacterium]|nr:hypothetical protein [Bacilli bacterium]HQG57438.1 hypothetical protein [Candidatus Dojkabacteria bacterium]